MVEITVCVGSTCHVKGSYGVAEAFKKEIEAQHLGDKVALKADFCMGDCVNGVCVKIGEEKLAHVVPEDVPSLMKGKVLPLTK